MRKGMVLCTVILTMALILLVIPTSFLNANPSNLVTNGDFSSGNLNGWNTVGDVSIYDDGGNNVAKCGSASGTVSEYKRIYRDIYPTTNDLSFSVKIKPINFAPGSGSFVIYATLISGVNSLGVFSVLYYPGDLPTGSWTTVTADLSGYPSFDKILLGANANLYTTIYFDDFTLTENAVNAPNAPSRPLTPEEQVLLNLSIGQQADLYGKSATGFIKTLYDNILGRVPDDGGLNNQVTALNDGTSPNQIIYNLVFSDELKPKISLMGPEEFITFLYKNVFNREPDPQGFANWVTKMKNGMSKEDVLINFLNSYEFKNICEMFGMDTNVDISGEDIIKVIYLNDQNAVIRFGHVAIILVKADGSGIYYSFAPKDTSIQTIIPKLNNVDGSIDRQYLSSSDMANFLPGGSGKLPLGREYTRFISISVNKDIGNIMFKIAESKCNVAPNMYNFYENNCNHFVQQILAAGKLNFNPVGMIPNDAYEVGLSQWSALEGFEAGSYN